MWYHPILSECNRQKIPVTNLRIQISDMTTTIAITIKMINISYTDDTKLLCVPIGAYKTWLNNDGHKNERCYNKYSLTKKSAYTKQSIIVEH